MQIFVTHEDLATIGERIRWVIEQKLGTKQAEFARRIQEKPPQLNRWVKDRNVPNDDALQKIASAGGVSVAWLRYGIGDPEVSEEGREEETPEDAVAGRAEGELFDDFDKIVRHLRRVGPPGQMQKRKEAAIRGLYDLLANTGGVPEWWYRLRDKLEAGEL